MLATLLALIALHGQFEGEAHDAFDAAASEDGGLDGDFIGLHLVDEAAHLGVLALGVLAHDDEIDVAAPGLGERRLHARVEIGRAHVGVLIEGAADGQQQAVERGVVGYLGWPTAPRRMASQGWRRSMAPAGIMRPQRK